MVATGPVPSVEALLYQAMPSEPNGEPVVRLRKVLPQSFRGLFPPCFPTHDEGVYIHEQFPECKS
jgi:hypothetical protein